MRWLLSFLLGVVAALPQETHSSVCPAITFKQEAFQDSNHYYVRVTPDRTTDQFAFFDVHFELTDAAGVVLEQANYPMIRYNANKEFLIELTSERMRAAVASGTNIVRYSFTYCLAANPSVDCNTALFTFILGQWKAGSVVCPTACGMSATVLQGSMTCMSASGAVLAPSMCPAGPGANQVNCPATAPCVVTTTRDVRVPVTIPVPVPVTVPVPAPVVRVPVNIPVPAPVEVRVPAPVAVKVPVPVSVPVTVSNPVPIPVQVPVAVPVAVPVSGFQSWAPPALPTLGAPVLGLQSWAPPGGGPIAALGASVVGVSPFASALPFASSPLINSGVSPFINSGVSPFNTGIGFGNDDLITPPQWSQSGPFQQQQAGLNTGSFQNAGSFQQLSQTLPQVSSTSTAPVTVQAPRVTTTTTTTTSSNGAAAAQVPPPVFQSGNIQAPFTNQALLSTTQALPSQALPSQALPSQALPSVQGLPSVSSVLPLSQGLPAAVGSGTIQGFPSTISSTLQSPLSSFSTQATTGPFSAGGPLGSFP